MLIWTLLIITVLIVLWVTVVRPLIRNKPFAKPFFDWIEPYERALYKKSEAIAWARFQQFIGILITLLAAIGALDVSIVVPVVPESVQPYVPLTITISGFIAEQLRRDTTKPLEVVAAPATPAVEAAVAKVDEANKEAKVVAASETARKEG